MDDRVKSLPIPIPTKTKINDPNIESWKSSLSQKISEKEAEIDEITQEISSLTNIYQQKEQELRTYSNDIKRVLSRLEKKIDNFSKEIYKDIANTKKLLHKEDRSLDLSPLRIKGSHLFQLFHELHKKASQFFSNKEFNQERSDLEQEHVQEKSLIQSLLSRIMEPERDDGNWSDWLDPIWSLEEHYRQSMKEYEIQFNEYDLISKKIRSANEKKDELTREHTILLKEKEVLQEFSTKIKECRMSDELYSDNEYLTPP